MVVMVKYSNQIDHLSDLPDDLLIKIISTFPTQFAARTSILSRRFHRLWTTFPSFSLISHALPQPQHENFASMAKNLLLRRNPFHLILSLHLEVSHCHQNASFLSSLLFNFSFLNLHHLTIEGCCFPSFLLLMPIIFSINSLRYLSLDCFLDPAFCFPSGFTLTCLTSLSLRLYMTDSAKLNQLLSELCSLEDLHLHIIESPRLSISSLKIRKLKLNVASNNPEVGHLDLYLPSLESLHLEILSGFKISSNIHVEVPLLRKAVINLHELHERDVRIVVGLLNCISHVEELSMYLKESEAINKLEQN